MSELRAALTPTLLAAYATVFVWASWRFGVPVDRVAVVLWLLGAVALAARTRLPALVLPVLRDWGVLLVLLLAYDLSRGAADAVGLPVQTRLPIRVDEALFGTVPTVALQGTLLPDDAAPWEVAVSAVYVSHFVVPLAVGMWLWVRRPRAEWIRWRRRLLGVTVIGLAGYVLVPTTPPWLAARNGDLEPVRRSAARGFGLIGLEAAERVVDLGRASANHVAAFPSLHMAYAVLAVPSLWYLRRARPVLVAYPLVMGFVLVLSGEHYVVDVLAGAGVTMAVVAVVRWWEARTTATVTAPERVGESFGAA